MNFGNWARDEKNAEDFCVRCEALYRDTIDGDSARHYIIFDGENVQTYETWGYGIPEDVWRGDAMIVARFGGDAEHGFVRQWMESDGSIVEVNEDGILRCGDYTEDDAIGDMTFEAMELGIIPTPWTLDDWIARNVADADVEL